MGRRLEAGTHRRQTSSTTIRLWRCKKFARRIGCGGIVTRRDAPPAPRANGSDRHDGEFREAKGGRTRIVRANGAPGGARTNGDRIMAPMLESPNRFGPNEKPHLSGLTICHVGHCAVCESQRVESHFSQSKQQDLCRRRSACEAMHSNCNVLEIIKTEQGRINHRRGDCVATICQ